MKLVPEPAPRELESVIEDGFECSIPEPAFFSRHFPLPARLSDLPLDRISPHKQFTMLFEDIERSRRAPNPLESAVLVGWRFFEWTDDGRLGARVWTLEGSADQWGLVYFNIGRYVAGSAAGFALAEDFPIDGDYYFRILALPQIYIFAVWLHSAGEDGGLGPDILLPLNPPPDDGLPPSIAPFEPLAFYTPTVFFSLVQHLLADARERSPRPSNIRRFESGGEDGRSRGSI